MAGKVGASEIIALEQQRRFGDHGNCIGKAVAHVERGWMAAFTEAVERSFCFAIMFLVESDRGYVREPDKLIDNVRSVGKSSSRQHHSTLKQGWPANRNCLLPNQRREPFGLWLPQGHCQDDRRIDSNHCGKPCSS